MNVEEAILELDIEQTIKELAIVCGYLQQEYKKQKELIDKIKNNINDYMESYELEITVEAFLNDVLLYIKEYEDDSKTNV